MKKNGRRLPCAKVIKGGVIVLPPPCPLSQKMSQGKNWCFTINNYTENELLSCHDLILNDNVLFVVFQTETGESGTPHVQGYLQLEKKKRLQQVKSLLSQRSHVELARGTPDQNVKYCTKEEGRLTGPFEYGAMSRGKGRRTDIKDFVETAQQKTLTEEELLNEFSDITAKYPKFVDRVLKFQKEKTVKIPEFSPRAGWQSLLESKLSEDPDRRKVHWYVDTVGNSGKSYFAHGYRSRPSYVITGGKHTDIFYSYNYEEVVFFDLPREVEDRTPYGVMEAFKNGYFLSTKYEVKRVRFNVPHVIIFSNFYPDKSKLSLDRWDVHVINENPLN